MPWRSAIYQMAELVMLTMTHSSSGAISEFLIRTSLVGLSSASLSSSTSCSLVPTSFIMYNLTFITTGLIKSNLQNCLILIPFKNSFLMHQKWKTYFICLFSYSTIHAIRTLWSAIKTDLKRDPFDFSIGFLGTLDMLVLFVLAISMNLVGSKIEKWGIRKTLITSMIGLACLTSIIGVFISLDFTAPWIYVILFSVGVGVLSCVGWPCCLCMVSFYFGRKDGIALSAYNGTSQMGDFLSLMSFYLIRRLLRWNEGLCFFFSSGYLVIFLLLIKNYIKSEEVSKSQGSPKETKNIQLNQENVPQLDQNQNKESIKTQKQHKPILDQVVSHDLPQSSSAKVTFLTVWFIPGVALNVLAYGFIKAVNAFIVGWLVYYLMNLGLGSDAVFMTILWSASVFVGGLASAMINKKYSKIHFVLQLLVSAICFYFLQEMHSKIYQKRIIFFICFCGLFYGGPYNLMSTAIPIVLGSKKSVRKYQNAKGMIISLMEGYGQFFCAMSLLLVPLFKVTNINLAGSFYCCIAFLLLLVQIVRQKRNKAQQDSSATV